MEMEFKDSSRRRTLVLVIGVLLALAAGAAAFMLSSQGQEQPEAAFPTREVVVAAEPIPARATIDTLQLVLRPVPVDDTTATAFTNRDDVGEPGGGHPHPAVPAHHAQHARRGRRRARSILKANETVAPDSPILRAVSLTVPADRAVGGLVAVGEHVDVIATVAHPVDRSRRPRDGRATGDRPRDGRADPLRDGSTTKLMWIDLEILLRDDGSDVYIVRADLQTSEEIAHAQTQGAEFTMVLRPPEDTRDIDRSTYGETTDTLITRYNFRVPEKIDGLEYPQPVAFPSPFPNEPYLSPRARSRRPALRVPSSWSPWSRPRPRGAPPAPTAARRTSARAHPRVRPRRTRGLDSREPDVSMRRSACGASRSARSAPCVARRRSMSAALHAAQPETRRWTSGGQSMSQTSSQRSASPPSTSLMASMTTNGSPSRRACSRRVSTRPRTAGWTMASRSRRAAGSAKTMPRQGGPVEHAGRPEDGLAEARVDGRQGGLAGRRDLTGEGVGVDDHATELAEHGRHGGLAAADGPGEPDDDRLTALVAHVLDGCRPPLAHAGARSSSVSQASSAWSRAALTSASSLPSRRSSTKLAWTAGLGQPGLQGHLALSEARQVALDALALAPVGVLREAAAAAPPARARAPALRRQEPRGRAAGRDGARSPGERSSCRRSDGRSGGRCRPALDEGRTGRPSRRASSPCAVQPLSVTAARQSR